MIRHQRLMDTGAFAVASIAVFVALAPLAWIVLTSLKPENQTLVYPPVLFPSPWTLDSYLAVLPRPTFLRSLLNSALYAGGSALITLVVAVPCGYAAARLRFWGRDLVLLAILGTSMIPGVALLVPLYFLFDRGGLVDNIVAIMLVYTATYVPQAIWFTRNFVETVPPGIEEAALIDGCSRLQTMIRVTLPLITPGLAAIVVLGFITVWNDYVYVAALTRDQSLQTVQVTLVNQVFESTGISWSLLSAFITVATFPILALFVWVQRWFVMGLSAGGMKG